MTMVQMKARAARVVLMVHGTVLREVKVAQVGRARHLLVEVLSSLDRLGRLTRDDGCRHLLTQKPVPIHLTKERIAPELNGTVGRTKALARVFGEQPSEEALRGWAHVLRKMDRRVRDALERRSRRRRRRRQGEDP